MPKEPASKGKKGGTPANTRKWQRRKSKSSAKRKRGHKSRSVVEFPVPRRITDEDFNEICLSFEVPAQHREALRRKLGAVVDHLIGWMETSEDRVPRTADRQSLERARAFLGKARFALRRKFGPVGADALRATGEILAPALDRHWLFDEFEDKEVELLRLPVHSEFHPPSHVSDESVRRDFCRTLPGPVLVSVLALLENSLVAALNVTRFLPGAHGGRPRLEARHFLLVNLAKIFWETFDAAPTMGESRFVTFVSAVCEAIGWEAATETVQHGVPKALNYWKNVTKKNHGISNSSPSE